MTDVAATAAPMTELAITVRWRDLDPLGHVNNAVFLTYLEEGRNRWLSAVLGSAYGLDEYVVARIEIDFTKEVPADAGSIVAGCRAEAIGRSSITTREVLRTRDGVVLSQARTVIVLWDPAARRTRPVNDDERARIVASMASADGDAGAAGRQAGGDGMAVG